MQVIDPPDIRPTLDSILTEIPEAEVRAYVAEAVRCFQAGAYNAAVVMGWCAVARYFRLLITAIDHDFFEFNYRKTFGDAPTDLVGDARLITACEGMGLMTGVGEKLEPFRQKRNQCAHPHDIWMTAEDVVRLIKDAAQRVLTHTVGQERLTSAGAVVTFARETDKVLPEARWRTLVERIEDEEERLHFAHGLLSAFFGMDGIRKAQNVVTLYHTTYDHLSKVRRSSLDQRLAKQVAISLGYELQDDEQGGWLLTGATDVGATRESREVVELADLIRWPAPDEANPYRDCVCECVLREFESRLTDREPDIPTRLLHRLRRGAPPQFQERVNGIYARLYSS